MTSLVLLGSARSKGNTYRAAQALCTRLSADFFDLQELNFGPFQYDQAYPPEDEFIAFIEAKLLQYDHIVFASPVYWYSMSGLMKHFFDRLSDLLKSQKPLGRQLRGKKMSVLACSSDQTRYESFFLPFRLSAEYLDMPYFNEWHSWIDEQGELQITTKDYEAI